MEEREEITRQLPDLLRDRKISEIRSILSNMHPIDIAQVLGEMPEDRLLMLFRILPKEMAADVFVEMDSDEQELLIKGFSDVELQAVLRELYVDDAVDLVEEMPAIVVNRVLRHTEPATRKLINEILKYPEDSAGSVMTTEYMSLKSSMTVEDAFERIRQTGDEKEDIYTCYVMDANRKLEGIVSVRELLLSDRKDTIGSIMETNVISVNTLADQETAAKLFDKYNLTALPVTDGENRLVGIITVDDAIDVLQEENTEDFEKMAALMPQDETYFETTVLQHARNRLPWLFILMFSSIMTGLIIEHYEVAFQTMPLLVALMPMLMDTGGNCGTQASTLMIRGLALDQIRLSDYLKALWKEIRVALLVGACLSLVNGFRVYIQYHDPKLAIVIGSTLLFVVIVAKALGCTLPMLAKKLHLDPAIMASPLMTTLVDVSAVWIYFQIATAVLL